MMNYVGTTKERLDRIETALSILQTKVGMLMAIDANAQKSLDALNVAVAAETTVEQSVNTLLTGLSAQIAALKNGVTDPAVLAAIDAASAIVTTNNAKFQADVVANTPAA